MNVFLCQACCTCLFIVLANVVVMTTSSDHPSGNEYPVNYFSGEFENFLHGLGSMVYKYKNPARQPPDAQYFINSNADPASTESSLHRRNNNFLNTPKDVIKDVLMMKLVSYYEDKYKVTHTDVQEIVTTTISTLLNSPKNVQSLTTLDQGPRSETSNNFKTSPETTKKQRTKVTTQQPIYNNIEEVEVL